MIQSSVPDKRVWWTEIRAADARSIEAHRRREPVPNTLMCCVFCKRPLEHWIEGCATGERKGELGPMLAWWRQSKAEAAGDIPRVFAAGLYCAGRDRCLDAAEDLGELHDHHASYMTGTQAIGWLERIVFDYPEWDPFALRRLVMCLTELSHLPTPVRKHHC